MSSAFAFLTGSTHFSKLRILLDFHTPALVFGQVPVEGVDFHHGHHVDLALHFFYGHEMTAWVAHQATVVETRSIFDSHARHGPCGIHYALAFDFSREKLENGLHTVESTSRSLGGNFDAGRSYHELVAFRVHIERRVDVQGDVAFCFADGKIEASRSLQLVHEEFSHALCFRSRSLESSA